jgi:hypothetical protein
VSYHRAISVNAAETNVAAKWVANSLNGKKIDFLLSKKL